MIKIAKNEQALADDLVGFAALDMGDKTNAAGVVFVSGIVEALGGDHDAWQ
jgi:F420-0:gamma-glutamyl ligase